MTIDEIGVERYVSLATFKKSGGVVKTPVWIASIDNALYVYSAGNAGKVKRIRANGKAQLAKCDLRGKLHSGYVNASARIVNDEKIRQQAFRALKKKYGWQMSVANFFAWISGKYAKRAVIVLDLL